MSIRSGAHTDSVNFCGGYLGFFEFMELLQWASEDPNMSKEGTTDRREYILRNLK